MTSSIRSAVTPDSARSGVAVANLDELVSAADRAVVEANVALVTSAPGAALLVWGLDAVCLAYNRFYRSLAGLRGTSLGRPLFKVQPELERAWRPKLELAYAGTSATIDGSALVGGPEGSGDTQLGWLVPVFGPSGAKGVLVIFMDAGVAVEPARRIVGALGQDLREPVIGIQVVAERLARLPKPTRERCVEDMERVVELTRMMDRLIDDMGAFSRRSAAAGGARLSLRHGDLGMLVKLACERIDVGKHPPVRVSAVEVPGLWDDEAIFRILSTLVTSACQSSDNAAVAVEVSASGREVAIITVRDDGPGLRSDDADLLFEPWRRGLPPGAERRRRGVGLGLFLARELVHAHGGRVTGERTPGGGFAMRVLLPIAGSGGSGAPSSRSFKTLG